MHYALALLPATHLPTVPLYTHKHTHTHTHTFVPFAVTSNGFLSLTLFTKSVHVHECTHLCTQLHCYMHVNNLYTIFRTHTHTHTHTNTCTLHARSVPLNLFSAYALAFYPIELLVRMFKRPLILFSISVWDWAFVLIVCRSLLIYVVDNFSSCM